MADWLKVLVDESKVALVVSGLPSALAVIKQNEQLEGRFLAPVEMQRFDWRIPAHRSEFAAITGAFEQSLVTQLDVPSFREPEMVFRLYCASGGLIGYLTKLLRQLVWTAAETQRKSLSLGDFDKAHALAVNWPKDLPRPFDKAFLSQCDDATLARIYGIVGASQVPPAAQGLRHKSVSPGYSEVFRAK